MCERLSVSANTLRTHTGHILHKLGVHSKLEAVVYGLRHGLLESPHEPRGADRGPLGRASPAADASHPGPWRPADDGPS